MKSFLDFAKDRENEELKRQIDHHDEMAEKHQEKAEAALMMGDRDGHALHMAKSIHFKTQCENLKSMKEEVERLDEAQTTLKMRPNGGADVMHPSSSKPIASITPKMDKFGGKHRATFWGHAAGTDQTKDFDSHEDAHKWVRNRQATATKGIRTLAKAVREEIDRFEEGAMPPSVIKVKEKIRMASDDENKKRFAGKSKNELSQMAKRHGYGDKNPYAKFHDGITEEVEQIDESTPAWQRKEGKSESGGLNKKGIMSYRRANPGSKLSMAVTTKPSKLKPGSKAANRRKSFCARMSGMKKRLTSAKTAKDPNSRINKSLRKWNC